MKPLREVLNPRPLFRDVDTQRLGEPRRSQCYITSLKGQSEEQLREGLVEPVKRESVEDLAAILEDIPDWD